MRTWALPLLSLSLVAALAGQEKATASASVANHLNIPVELSKAIKAEKARPGDEVRLRMAEPVLVGKGIVIPGNAKLFGHVLHASGAENGRHSHLAIIVERAEWKHNVLKLRAFIAGFAVKKQKQVTNNGQECGSPSQSPPAGFRRRRKPLQQTMNSDTEFDGCENGEEQAALLRNNMKFLSQIRMMQDQRDGHTILVSDKNIHLPSGMLLILENWNAAVFTARE